MIFQDNVLKEYLKNVYFVTGTPCGGKTTISRELANRHNILVYDIDEQFEKHQQVSNAAFQPAMNKKFKDADEFFLRTVDDYKKWLLDNTREQLDFVLLLNEKYYWDIKGSGYFWLERTPQSTVKETADKVERYFGLVNLL
ncbi:MAG: hypothetical protein HFI55_11175 [Lachnospiraceae bacterium]|nr:hypothetical protein [Lachnospiraceae bacterium]